MALLTYKITSWFDEIFFSESRFSIFTQCSVPYLFLQLLLRQTKYVYFYNMYVQYFIFKVNLNILMHYLLNCVGNWSSIIFATLLGRRTILPPKQGAENLILKLFYFAKKYILSPLGWLMYPVPGKSLKDWLFLVNVFFFRYARAQRDQRTA